MKITRIKIRTQSDFTVKWIFESDLAFIEAEFPDHEISRMLTNTCNEGGIGIFSEDSVTFQRGNLDVVVDLGKLPSNGATSQEWVDEIKRRIDLVNEAFKKARLEGVDIGTVEF
jgi:hypothetical protein